MLKSYLHVGQLCEDSFFCLSCVLQDKTDVTLEDKDEIEVGKVGSRGEGRDTAGISGIGEGRGRSNI